MESHEEITLTDIKLVSVREGMGLPFERSFCFPLGRKDICTLHGSVYWGISGGLHRYRYRVLLLQKRGGEIRCREIARGFQYIKVEELEVVNSVIVVRVGNGGGNRDTAPFTYHVGFDQ